MIEGVIDRPMRLFAPSFGAGAVGGYTVLRINPAIIAKVDRRKRDDGQPAFPADGASSEDVRVAFGG